MSAAVVSTPSVVEAISAVMAAVLKVGKGSENRAQGYAFRGIDDVLNEVGPALRANGVVVVPLVEEVSYGTVEVGVKRTPMRECTVRVRYVFYGPAGDSIPCVVVGEAMDSGDKATPKAMSVAFRTALLQALAIPSGDPDPDSQSYERAPARPEPVAPAEPTPTQRARYDELVKLIPTASTVSALQVAWDMLVDAYKADEVTTVQANEVKELIRVRKAVVVDDGSSDSHGDSAQPRPAGEGPRSDGEGAEPGGSGRDGETGGSRSGVQSGVHRGGRAGGSAPASGGHRDTSAAVGGGRG